MALEVNWPHNIQRALDAVYGSVEGTLLVREVSAREIAFFRYGVMLALSMVACIFGVESPMQYKEMDRVRKLLEGGQ
jgi:hypothetical protein